MKKSYISFFSFLFFAGFLACTPIMDTPKPGDYNDPTRPDAPPQVIFMPEGVEVTSLAIQGDYLYATAPTQGKVYRMRINDEKNLSRTANAVPYADVPGANAITAGANHTLFIGASGAPKPGATEHKWTDDKVVYLAQTTEAWHSRFANNPARRMFEAPRGSFNALTVYNNNLYYAAGSPLEGMGINSKRYTQSLDAVVNLLDEDLNFLVQLALGEADFSNIELGDILRMANMFKLNLDIDALGSLDLDNIDTDALIDLALDNLGNFIAVGMNGSGTTITITIPVDLGSINIFGNDINLKFDIPVPISLSSLSLEPRWGLNLVTIWAPPLEIPATEVEGLMDDLLTPAFWAENVGAINDAAKGFVADFDLKPIVVDLIGQALADVLDGLYTKWQSDAKNLANDAIDGIVTVDGMAKNLTSENLEGLIKDYIFTDTDGAKKMSLNGIYKDQPGQYPPRPYFLDYPISPSDFFDEDRNINLKLALTLALLQLKGQDDVPFSIIDGAAQFDAFLAALNQGGDILEQIKSMVDALGLKQLLDNEQLVIGNPRLRAYLQFLADVSESSFELNTTIDRLYELMLAFDITVDFRTLLEAWWHLPDWSELPGTHVGVIAPHELLGSIYAEIDNFVDGISNSFLQGIAGWVTSKIPRVNSARAFGYGGSGVNPTGLAFGRDAQGFDAGWIVDNGALYALNLSGGGGAGARTIERDDYLYSDTYPAPSGPWAKNSRGRWTLSVAPVSGPRTNLAGLAPAILENSWGIIYDNENQRVLVSCKDGSNKGRIVSVRYKSWNTFPGASYPGFFPPPPRVPIQPFSTSGAAAEYDIQEYIPADGELNHPKGMAMRNKYLFVADGDRIVVYYMGKSETEETP